MGIVGSSIVALLPFAPRFVVRWVAKRYVAGETLDQAIAVMSRISPEGACFTVDVLGEEIRTMEETRFFINEYERALDAIVENRLDANISIKPTAFGLLINREAALDNIERIVSKASEDGIFVRLDMEDSRVTQPTIDVLLSIHDRGYTNVGLAIQGRLNRSVDDINMICDQIGNHSDFRVCKGIYLEPKEIAKTGYREIVNSTNEVVDIAIRRGSYVAIASHDDPVIKHSLQSIISAGMGPEKADPRPNPPLARAGKGNGYEFQFLLGVRGDVRRSLASEGHVTRVYLPYGKRWYEYSMRRLRENPEVAVHVTKALLLPWTNRR
jgi:proline dehydrogenase